MFTHELAWQFHFIDFATELLERREERLNEFAGFQLGQHLFSFFSRHVQLTSYLRGLPADGWLRVVCTCVQIGQDWFDEDHIVVDCEGHIVVQSRQLAMVPPPQ